MRRELIEVACPECETWCGFVPERAGSDSRCDCCNTTFTVPTGLPTRLVSVAPGPGKELTPQEAAEVRKNLPARMQMPQRRQVIVPEVVDDEFDGELEVPRRRRAPVDDDKPVNLRLGELAEMNVPVGKRTRDAMAMTFLGGVLGLLGVIVAIIFGGKSKSS
jgi:hypothetical protein